MVTGRGVMKRRGILIEIFGAFVILWAAFRTRKQIRHIPNTYDADLPVKLGDIVANQAFPERTSKWDKLTTLCTAIGVILVIIQIVVMWRQTTIMERQTDISAQQTQLTERQ